MEAKQELPQGYFIQQSVVLKRGHIVVVANSPFKEKILQYIHSYPQVGHLGFLKIYQRAKAKFYSRGIKKTLQNWFENV